MTDEHPLPASGVSAGNEPPLVRVRAPGPEARAWLARAAAVGAPMGPRRSSDANDGTIVYRDGLGSNVFDVDGNRYVDLCGGFGAQLLGHCHPAITSVVTSQSRRLLQALGDVHPAVEKVLLAERLAALFPEPGAQVILGQSGADAVTAALKTAVLCTGRAGVIAFQGAYHGLSYAPLSVCGLRESYRAPFEAHLSRDVTFAAYPADEAAATAAIGEVSSRLRRGGVGCVLIEPVLGRGGCVVPPAGFLGELARVVCEAGALLIADEIWTGLGRSGAMLRSVADGVTPDLVCLGKGLGGGVPVSACVGRRTVMREWSRDAEVVHTSTFAGAPLAAAAAVATLTELASWGLAERAELLGERFRQRLRSALGVDRVRGRGLMIGVDVGGGPGTAVTLARRLLARGYIVSTGGGRREVLVLTPPLTIAEELIEGFVSELSGVVAWGGS
ncbi:MAG: aspartate aminotransferase family protein [Polyangiaceae bacterium]|nr:aspartate aminotransferase family protein [Polyangiaceae bacterium]